MHSGDVALRLSCVFSVATFIVMAASIYEIDRREKSGSGTVMANFTEIERQVQILSDNHSLNIQMQAIESRLNALGDDLHFRRERRL